MRIASAFVAVVLAGAIPVRGQEPPPPVTSEAPPTSLPPASAEPAAPPETAPDPVHTIPKPTQMLPAETDVTLDQRSAFQAGVGFGGPVGASVRLRLLRGLGADVRDKNERVKAVCALPIPFCAGGFLVDAEVGSGGGKLGLGVGAEARVRSDDFRGTVGTGFKLTIARTWGSPIGTDPGLTYLGPELDLYILRAGLSLGVLWRVTGIGGSSAVFSWGLGIGL